MPDEIAEETMVNTVSLSEPGRTVAGRYKIIEEIGSGGMGTVYRVEHLLLHKIMALKVMRSDKNTKTDISRFQREAKAASALNHPNLVRVYDFGTTDDGQLYLSMDYAEGHSLSREIELKGAMAQEKAIDLFIEICRGMAAAHRAGIIHRDLKPSNIAISNDEKSVARVLDFGIARVEGADAETINKVTQTGEVLGSPAYMSPEQCTGCATVARSDIYSLGCVMFEVLTGRSPFVADSPLALLYKHLNERAPLLRSANEHVKVSPELERVVLQALEKDPQNRYQSMDDLADDLELIKQGKNPTREVARMRDNMRKVAWLSKMGLIAMGLVGLVVLIPATFMIHEMVKPKWEKEFDQAEGQWQIKNNAAALPLFKAAVYCEYN
jgi:serine/threonine-protein kinase